MKFDVIGFDADDTLWHNEWLYQRMRDEFTQLYSGEFDPPVSYTHLTLPTTPYV